MTPEVIRDRRILSVDDRPGDVLVASSLAEVALGRADTLTMVNALTLIAAVAEHGWPLQALWRAGRKSCALAAGTAFLCGPSRPRKNRGSGRGKRPSRVPEVVQTAPVDDDGDETGWNEEGYEVLVVLVGENAVD